MTNKEVAKLFDFTAQLMELHDENPFKIRSYQYAYNAIRLFESSILEKTIEELTEIKGLGKSIATQIIELKNTGKLSILERLKEITPDGLIDILKIKGLGPKKIRALRLDLGIESLGELEYAINENRLKSIKGFGQKTIDDLLSQISFLNSSKGKLLYHKALILAERIIFNLKSVYPNSRFELTGELRRKMPVINSIEILTDNEITDFATLNKLGFSISENRFFFENIVAIFKYLKTESYGWKLIETTGPKEFVDMLTQMDSDNESSIFFSNKLPYIPSHFRDNPMVLKNPASFEMEKFASMSDIKGVIHNHSTWSDGTDTIESLALYYQSLGYQYMVMSDHSQSAFYANGIKLGDIDRYVEEIKQVDKNLDNFKVYSGIESDILFDGNLDYDDDTLRKFDLVIASVHSILRMDVKKATDRIVRAIENKHTRIIGHLTGRILLARSGYPLDFEAVFESCRINEVAIEFNVNPQRLDVDWTWIESIQDRGIMISINPDAHSKKEVHYMDYGVELAQKGGLLKEKCLNAMNNTQFDNWLKNKTI